MSAILQSRQYSYEELLPIIGYGAPVRERPCQMCGEPIPPARGRPKLMHPECRRMERAEYHRLLRAEQKLAHADEATARKVADLTAAYETRVARAAWEARYYESLLDSALWWLLTKPDAYGRIRDLLEWARDFPEPTNIYERQVWQARRTTASDLLGALHGVGDHPANWPW